jgi:2-polyprenyl-3-methyl-5-hydroxy-6-metoxy-1,4-benzoquinol methylase
MRLGKFLTTDSTKPRGALARALRWAGSRRRVLRGQGRERSAAEWDQEYAAGRWAYLEETSELARHAVLVSYMEHLRVADAVLDVGCGTGVLFEKLRPLGCRRYLGVDLSAAAIDIASARFSDPRGSFVAADGQAFEPPGEFDCVVFNEVLYFFRDPAATVERYERWLRPGGLVLVSTCTAFSGGERILERLKSRRALVDETRVTAGDREWSWIVSVLRPADQLARTIPAV